VILNILR